MMQKFLTAEGYGQYGLRFTVNFWRFDSTVEFTLHTFQLDGLNKEYRPDTEEYFPGIIPSELRVGYLVENETDRDRITSLIDVQDREVFVEVYTDSILGISKSGILDWRGWLMVDNLSLEDAVYPYTVMLTAVDGLADLRNNDWDQAGEELTIVQVIEEAIKTIGTYELYGDDDNMIRTCVDLYEAQMPARSLANDPMNLTRLQGGTYYQRSIDKDGFAQYDVDEDGNAFPMSYYEVLTDICRAFNARLSMSKGMMTFFNPFTSYDAATAKVTTYTKALAATGANQNLTISVDKSDYAREAGGTDTLLPQAYLTKTSYQHLTGTNIFPQKGIFVILANFFPVPSYNLVGIVTSNVGNKLVFTATITMIMERFVAAMLARDYYLRFELRVRVVGATTYYLQGSNLPGGTKIWSTTVSSYNIYLPFSMGLLQKTSLVKDFIQVHTPDIPITGTCSYSIVLGGIVEFFSPLTSAVYDFDQFGGWVDAFSISYIIDNESIESMSYESEVLAPTTTSIVNDLGVTYIGDGIASITPGRLEVWDGSAWVLSSVWQVKDAGLAYDIGELRCIQVMGLSYTSIYMMQGVVISFLSTTTPEIEQKLSYEGMTFIPNLLNVSYDDQSADGEWFRIDLFDMTKAGYNQKPRPRRNIQVGATNVPGGFRMIGDNEEEFITRTADLVRFKGVGLEVVVTEDGDGVKEVTYAGGDISRFPKDIQRYGFLNQTDTAISFDVETQIFTLTDMGAGWGYYRDGDLALITGNRTVDVKTAEEGLPLVDGELYYIYIDDQLGTLIADKAEWTLLDTKVPVSYLVYDNALTPKSWTAEERHACLIDRREHYREHLTEGTKALRVGELLGYTLNSDVDANKVFSIGESLIIDEDIILTLAMLPKPDGVSADYVVFYRATADRWAWEFSKMPFKFNSATNWIQWDNNGVLTDATGGTGSNTRWINTYLTLTNFQGEARFLFFSGQNIFTDFDTAKDEDISTFTWGNFVIVESVLVYRLTWTTITSTSTGKCRLAAVAPIAVNPIVTPTAGGGIAHNTLGGLQGGTVTERYHLTELQRDRAIKAVKALKISIIGL